LLANSGRAGTAYALYSGLIPERKQTPDDQKEPMNAANALIFAVLGAAMELVPKAFPGWFLHLDGDCSGARELWLRVMGMVQIGLGLSHFVRTHFVPLSVRILAPAGGSEVLALSNTRSAAGR
jgi:hypothetical protein